LTYGIKASHKILKIQFKFWEEFLIYWNPKSNQIQIFDFGFYFNFWLIFFNEFFTVGMVKTTKTHNFFWWALLRWKLKNMMKSAAFLINGLTYSFLISTFCAKVQIKIKNTKLSTRSKGNQIREKWTNFPDPPLTWFLFCSAV
jgi:hypothetical protein